MTPLLLLCGLMHDTMLVACCPSPAVCRSGLAPWTQGADIRGWMMQHASRWENDFYGMATADIAQRATMEELCAALQARAADGA